MKKALTAALLFLFIGCAGTTEHKPPPEATTLHIADLPTFECKTWEDDEENPDGETGEELLEDSPGLEALGSGDIYRGTCRKKAKLSFPSSSVTTFSGIAEWLATLPDDDEMQDRHISRAADSGRTPIERKNIEIPAFLLASNRPKDRDFHVILGDHPTNPTVCINVEVSGLAKLPRDDAFTTPEHAEQLRRVRDFFKNRMGSGTPSSSRYKFYSPGIPVQVTGAALYDSCHTPGDVGPTRFRPFLTTCWELHPVSFIRFVQVH